MSFGGVRLSTCVIAGLMTLSMVEIARSQQSAVADAQSEIADGTLARIVRDSTASIRDAQAAVAAGYVLANAAFIGYPN